jgi:hypothetical protein
MKTTLIFAVSSVFWFGAAPAIAQTPHTAVEKPPKAAPAGQQPQPASQPPANGAQEISHQAMVEEQERRDREAQAERDRDDQT